MVQLQVWGSTLQKMGHLINRRGKTFCISYFGESRRCVLPSSVWSGLWRRQSDGESTRLVTGPVCPVIRAGRGWDIWETHRRPHPSPPTRLCTCVFTQRPNRRMACIRHVKVFFVGFPNVNLCPAAGLRWFRSHLQLLQHGEASLILHEGLARRPWGPCGPLFKSFHC